MGKDFKTVNFSVPIEIVSRKKVFPKLTWLDLIEVGIETIEKEVNSHGQSDAKPKQ